MDIYARTEKGEYINIEIQVADKYDMKKRTLYYWSRIYSSQMKKGMSYANDLERWLLLLEADEHEDIRKELEAIAMQDPVMKRAFEKWEDLSPDDKMWIEYETRKKAIQDELSAAREAELRQQKAREEGLAEGKAGIVRNMLAKGLDVSEIAELTGLPKAEIEKQKQQLH